MRSTMGDAPCGSVKMPVSAGVALDTAAPSAGDVSTAAGGVFSIHSA